MTNDNGGLDEHPDEFERSFDAVLINVTECFLNAAAWQHLSPHVAPDLLPQSQDHETLRVWPPGCSSGEETYAVAMALAEALGEDAVRSGMKIHGTDVDRDARTWPGHTVDRHGTVTPVVGRDDLPRGATVVTAVTDAHGDT